jgi:hypothetical protein
MDPQHRYIIFRGSEPVYTSNSYKWLISYLWGRDIKDNYVVYDYERPYPVDNPNLTDWLERLEEAAYDT